MKRLFFKGFLLFFALGTGSHSAALAQTRQDLMGNKAHMHAIELNPSPALLDYQAVMMPVQRELMKAYYAGICQFRGESYFRTFQVASIEISRIEATKRNLSNDEIVYADNAAKQIMQREDAEAGFSDLERRCRALSARLPQLDAMERALAASHP